MKLLSLPLCRGAISGMICLLIFAGCAPTPRGGVPLAAIDKALTEPDVPVAKGAVPPPPAEIRSALIPPPLEAYIAPHSEAEPRFDIAASKVPARDFFMSLVEGSPIRMVVHPDVAGEISVDLKSTTVAEVLQVIKNV
ncbi:MAG: pilus (MSHA type) biogenesis protein MshL, partial [Desulfuromonadales bacterium]|nr:pilus (MSHA type) biogenesis protein MshL [Desulfuromonadales bacterium]